MSEEALNSERPDVEQFPYGALVLPSTDHRGAAVVVVREPGSKGRNDVLVVEHPAGLHIASDACEPLQAERIPGLDTARIRVPMCHHPGDTAQPPDTFAVLRIETALGPAQTLDSATKQALRRICYTIRVEDRTGWFDYDGVHSDPFRHGYPDIATRDQGPAGIRGPSWLAMGIVSSIGESHFHPRLPRDTLAPGERVIYELHVGTFTPRGSLASAIHRLPALRTLGFSTIQLMPLDISSGPPGWTYDQTRTGAVEAAQYGGASALIAFVSRAHELGLEVIVDKQYNHEGPEQDSRSRFIPGMFARETQWGAGLSGREQRHYPQIIKLIGEELAYWVTHYGIDGYRLDATNRLPWEVHEQIAGFVAQISAAVQKPLYLLSEYAECEAPTGKRVPAGHQYAEEPGRYLMKLLDLSTAVHVVHLPSDAGSFLRPMLLSARRGWWYPDLPSPEGGLRGAERVTSLLWHHDWIGNRFGGERINALVSFDIFKAVTVWQLLGQWTPLIFMGTERYAQTPWYFFTGHQDSSTRNNTSAYYNDNENPALNGGRFYQFAPEAEAAGLQHALAFSHDGTRSGIDWEAFRRQSDRWGREYMDHARIETFEASKLDWDHSSPEQVAVQRLFRKLLAARRDARIAEEDPKHAQYKGWNGSEHFFVLRRRAPGGSEFIALVNLGAGPASVTISPAGIHAAACGEGSIPSLRDGETEPEWSGLGSYSLSVDTRSRTYGGPSPVRRLRFQIKEGHSRNIEIAPESALVFSKLPLASTQHR